MTMGLRLRDRSRSWKSCSRSIPLFRQGPAGATPWSFCRGEAERPNIHSYRQAKPWRPSQPWSAWQRLGVSFFSYEFQNRRTGRMGRPHAGPFHHRSYNSMGFVNRIFQTRSPLKFLALQAPTAWHNLVQESTKEQHSSRLNDRKADVSLGQSAVSLHGTWRQITLNVRPGVRMSEELLIDQVTDATHGVYQPYGWHHLPLIPWMSYQFRRALGETQEGDRAVSECFLAASRMIPGDDESWHRDTNRIAHFNKERGDDEFSKSHVRTAMNCW